MLPLRRILVIALAYIQLTVGAICIALSLDIFLIPNNVVSGGLTGVAQLLHSIFATPVGLVTLAMNIPLFVLGWRYLGGLTFGARTLYATVVLSLAIDLLTPSKHALPWMSHSCMFSTVGCWMALALVWSSEHSARPEALISSPGFSSSGADCVWDRACLL